MGFSEFENSILDVETLTACCGSGEVLKHPSAFGHEVQRRSTGPPVKLDDSIRLTDDSDSLKSGSLLQV